MSKRNEGDLLNYRLTPPAGGDLIDRANEEEQNVEEILPMAKRKCRGRYEKRDVWFSERLGAHLGLEHIRFSVVRKTREW